MTATIRSIVYKPQHVESQPPDHFSRIPLEKARLIQDYGIEGDMRGGPGDRQINVMSAETLAELAAEGFKTGPGQMGEQIIIDGLRVDDLAAGDRFRIGDRAVLEVVKPRTGCKRFVAIQGLSNTLAAGRMGMMVRVVTGGIIHVNDPVFKLQDEGDHVGIRDR